MQLKNQGIILKNDGRWARYGIQIMVRRLIRLAGITGVKIGSHMFRHFLAENYLENDGDKATLQTLLGHSTDKMATRAGCGKMYNSLTSTLPLTVFPRKYKETP